MDAVQVAVPNLQREFATAMKDLENPQLRPQFWERPTNSCQNDALMSRSPAVTTASTLGLVSEVDELKQWMQREKQYMTSHRSGLKGQESWFLLPLLRLNNDH